MKAKKGQEIDELLISIAVYSNYERDLLFIYIVELYWIVKTKQETFRIAINKNT